jgi:predicted transcriptional regulator
MVKTTVYLDDEIVAALRGMAKRSAKPQAQLIRDALYAYAKKDHAPPLPAGMGMFDSGHRDTSSQRKELLKEGARSRLWRS